MDFKLVVVLVGAILLVGLGVMLLFPPQDAVIGDVHVHADFKVYLNNEAVNFSQDKYMSTANNTLNNFVHLHDGDGEVIHVHISGVTLGEFFSSLGMAFNSTCFTFEEQVFCNEGDKTLKLFVNGQSSSDFQRYLIHDLDRILISYGSGSETSLAQQLNSITDKACIQSLKCPERGQASNESSCLTGSDCVA